MILKSVVDWNGLGYEKSVRLIIKTKKSIKANNTLEHQTRDPGSGQYFTHNYAFICAGIQVYQVIFFPSRDKGEITRGCHAIIRVRQGLKVLLLRRDGSRARRRRTDTADSWEVKVALSSCPILPERSWSECEWVFKTDHFRYSLTNESDSNSHFW